MRRALDNLIDNGLRYAPAGSSIEVWAEPGPLAGKVSLCVRDHGPGIADSMRERIFEKYGQAEPGSRGGNQGLGLTFVRLAGEAHGGAATVESPATGGCLFRIQLIFNPHISSKSLPTITGPRKCMRAASIHI